MSIASMVNFPVLGLVESTVLGCSFNWDVSNMDDWQDDVQELIEDGHEVYLSLIVGHDGDADDFELVTTADGDVFRLCSALEVTDDEVTYHLPDDGWDCPNVQTLIEDGDDVYVSLAVETGNELSSDDVELLTTDIIAKYEEARWAEYEEFLQLQLQIVTHAIKAHFNVPWRLFKGILDSWTAAAYGSWTPLSWYFWWHAAGHFLQAGAHAAAYFAMPAVLVGSWAHYLYTGNLDGTRFVTDILSTVK